MCIKRISAGTLHANLKINSIFYLPYIIANYACHYEPQEFFKHLKNVHFVHKLISNQCANIHSINLSSTFCSLCCIDENDYISLRVVGLNAGC